MNMTKWIWAAMLIAAMMLTGAGVARADDAPAKADHPQRQHENGARPHGEAGGPAQMMSRVLAQLDLTADQKSAIKKLVDDFRQKEQAWRKDHMDQLRPIYEKLMQARKDHDREAMQAAIAELRKLHESTGAPDPRDLVDKIKGQLTEEQQAKLQKMIDEHRKQAGDRPDRPQRNKNK